MLDISPVLLLVVAGIFLVLLVLLNKILYRPLLDFMHSRDESIKKDLQSLDKNSDEVKSLHEEAQSIISKAKAEAAKIRQEAYEGAKEMAEKKLELKKSELEKSYAAFCEELKAQKVELKNGLLAQMPLFKEGVKVKLSQI